MTNWKMKSAGYLTQKDLVARLDVEQATMANTITRMERDGLIERRPMSTDKRAKAIVATEKAKAIQKDAIDAAMRVNRSFLEVLSPDEQTQLLDLMRRIVENKTQSKG